MTRPAMAKPSPFRRPPLFLISEREMCPRTTATIKSGNILMMPHTRLAIAFPLVCAVPANEGGGTAGGANPAGGTETCAGCIRLPQFEQNCALSAKVAPHLGQIKFVPPFSECRL